MPRFLLAHLVLLVLLCACAPSASPPPVPVPSDWVEVGEHRLPAQVFDGYDPSDSGETIAWEQEPVAWVWEGGWPRYGEFLLPPGLRPVDVAFLDVGGRVQELFLQEACPVDRDAGCLVKAAMPVASVLVLEAGLAELAGLRKSSLVRMERSDRVSEVEARGLGQQSHGGFGLTPRDGRIVFHEKFD